MLRRAKRRAKLRKRSLRKTCPPRLKPGFKAASSRPPGPPLKLACKALRGDIGIYEPLRYLSITVDTEKKHVRMVHEGDGKAFEYRDGASAGTGGRHFVTVTEEAIVYGQGGEQWKIDRYTGTLTNSRIGIPFECQVRPSERKF